MAAMRPQHVLILITISSFLSLLSAQESECVPRSSLYAVPLPKFISIAPLKPFNVFCNKTTYPHVCQTAIDTNLLPNSGDDLPAVTKANILFAINKLTYTITAAKRFIANPTTSLSMVTLLKDTCLGMYKSMLDEYHVALSNIDFATKETNIDAALTDIGTCIDSYTDPMLAAVIQISVLATEDEALRKTATNIVDLRNGLKF